AQQPHQRWQIDACDQLRLAGGQPFSWLRGADECTGTVLGTVVFPPRAIQPGAAGAGAGAVSPVVPTLGLAGRSAPGQWPSLGRVVRLTDDVCVVVDRPGAEGSLQPGSATPGEWGDRAVQWVRAAVGRGVEVPQCRGGPSAPGRGR